MLSAVLSSLMFSVILCRLCELNFSRRSKVKRGIFQVLKLCSDRAISLTHTLYLAVQLSGFLCEVQFGSGTQD